MWQLFEEGSTVQRVGYYASESRFLTKVGELPEFLSLPTGTRTDIITQFKIIKPFYMETGTVAPWFNSIGTGTQYYPEASITDLINWGYLEEIPK